MLPDGAINVETASMPTSANVAESRFDASFVTRINAARHLADKATRAQQSSFGQMSGCGRAGLLGLSSTLEGAVLGLFNATAGVRHPRPGPSTAICTGGHCR